MSFATQPRDRHQLRLPIARNIGRSAALLLLAVCYGGAVALGGEAGEVIVDFVETHCLECHSGDDAERGFDLDGLAVELHDATIHEKWVRALDRVRRGEMPPSDADQPGRGEINAFVQSLQPALIDAEKTRIANEGRAPLRRLSRAEHINALRDLLHLPLLDAGEKLPPDPLSDGFGKSSSSLPFSHVQIDRYLEVADDAVRAAMAPTREKPTTKETSVVIKDLRGQTVLLRQGTPDERSTLRLIRDANALYLEFKHGSAVPLIGRQRDETFATWPGDFKTKTPGFVVDEKPYIDAIGLLSHAPLQIGRAEAAGRYRIRVKAFAFQANHGRVEATEHTEVIAVYGGSRLLGAMDVTADEAAHELEVLLQAGEEIKFAMASLPLWRIEIGDKRQRFMSVNVPAVAVKSFAITGPLIETWPPASHQRLFADLPLVEDNSPDGSLDYRVVSDNPTADARRLLASFMADAYRREVVEDDFRIPMGMFERRRGSGATFEEAMIASYGAVLSSPSFTLVAMQPGKLPPSQLANRLSLFLWNTPADAKLRKSLTLEVIDDPQRYAALVDKMLDDARTERFVDHFLDHWLDLLSIGVTEPDENLYSGYSTWMLESMLLETRGYFHAMLRDDLPAGAVIDSDFAMVNGVLAELYGIDGPVGAEIRKVALPPDSVRGGLLTQASVMKVSANGTTTSPVVRGVYVMDRLLGDPPPPPPEAVAAVEPDLSGVTTIREQLARHRAEESCATCHRKIDPPGFALESFDVMGRYRERYHSLENGQPVAGINRRAKPIGYKLAQPVDCSGEMADGRTFADVDQFRSLVLQDQRAIARNLLERLIVYATGQPVGISDREIVEEILETTAARGYGLRSMIHALVQSPLFTRK